MGAAGVLKHMRAIVEAIQIAIDTIYRQQPHLSADNTSWLQGFVHVLKEWLQATEPLSIQGTNSRQQLPHPLAPAIAVAFVDTTVLPCIQGTQAHQTPANVN